MSGMLNVLSTPINVIVRINDIPHTLEVDTEVSLMLISVQTLHQILPSLHLTL